MYITWFDKRLRVCIFDSKYGITFYKVTTDNDISFKLKDKIYVLDKKAIYRRFLKIPYAFYYSNNPNPIIINKQEKKKGVTANYTAQELHHLLDVNYTLNLIRPNVNTKKIIMGTAILIAVAIVGALILHFTGVIDIQTMFLQQGASNGS